jgi:ribonuclease-3
MSAPTPSHRPSRLASRLEELEQVLGVSFNDRALLELALVHSSYLAEFPGVYPGSNERLEFLGDALVDLVVAHELYSRFPSRPEGQLTQMRAALVSKEALARVADALDLGRSLVMGRGETNTGGVERESNQANAFEAVVGAIFLDQGYEVASRFVLDVMADPMRDVFESEEPPKHPKTRLHEEAMARGLAPPDYRVVAETSLDRQLEFTVEVILDGTPAGQGKGRRKAYAEREAALQALKAMGHEA